MKFIKSAFISIPDQVVMTLSIWAFGLVFYRGIKSVITEFPSRTTLLIVIFIGMILGLLTARTQMPANSEKANDTPNIDR